MIDIHCHILPGIDDGPRDMEETKKMIEMMYDDGIRGVIATSHYNHSIDFHSSLSYGESFDAVRSFLNHNYPDFHIYRGTEFRILPNYLELLDENREEIVLNGSNYVLIEYRDEIDIEYALEVIYEFKIRNYIPIVAHIDRYPTLYKKSSNLERLREEGALIQLSARKILKRSSQYRKMKKILKNGYIDFIASDGHSADKRKPLLREAYEEVSNILSRSDANRIFIENPQLIVERKSW